MPQVDTPSTESQELQHVDSKVQLQVPPAQTPPPVKVPGYLQIISSLVLGLFFAQTTLCYCTLDVSQDCERVEEISFCMKFAVAAALEWIRWIANWLLEIDMYVIMWLLGIGGTRSSGH
jgi:hypothetical protein